MGRTRAVTLTEAAQVLGISKEAVRKRVQRGTLPSDVGEDGRRYVYLDAVGDAWPPGAHLDDDPREELIATLRDQLEAEREANRENRRIIAALASRIPELEAPREEPEPPESAGDTPDTAEPRSTTEEQQEPTSQPQEEQRSWWRRMFGT
jgi:hypothetical protein